MNNNNWTHTHQIKTKFVSQKCVIRAVTLHRYTKLTIFLNKCSQLLPFFREKNGWKIFICCNLNSCVAFVTFLVQSESVRNFLKQCPWVWSKYYSKEANALVRRIFSLWSYYNSAVPALKCANLCFIVFQVVYIILFVRLLYQSPTEYIEPIKENPFAHKLHVVAVFDFFMA